jgi:hypothetical protein
MTACQRTDPPSQRFYDRWKLVVVYSELTHGLINIPILGSSTLAGMHDCGVSRSLMFIEYVLIESLPLSLALTLFQRLWQNSPKTLEVFVSLC